MKWNGRKTISVRSCSYSELMTSIGQYNGQEMTEYVTAAKVEGLPVEVVTRAQHIVMDAIDALLALRNESGVKFDERYRGI